MPRAKRAVDQARDLIAAREAIVRSRGRLDDTGDPKLVRLSIAVRAEIIDAFVTEKVAKITSDAIDVPGAHAVRRPPTAPKSLPKTKDGKRKLKRALAFSGGRSFPYNALLDVLEKQGRPFRKITPSVLQLVKREMMASLGTPTTYAGGLTQTLLRTETEAALAEAFSQRLGGTRLYGISPRPLTKKYRLWKSEHYPNRPIGFLTGELFQSVQEKLKVKWGLVR